MSGRLAVVAWVFTIVGMRAAAGAIRRMYRFDRHRGAAEPARLQEDTVEAEEPGCRYAVSLIYI